CAVKHSEIRGRIIETASELFYQNGYNSTGINEIIAKSGIAKATLYSHFKSKEDICVAYLQHKNAIFIKDIEAYTTSKPKGKDQVLALFDFLNEFFQDKEFNGCWCVKTVAEIPRENEKVRKEIQSQKRDLIQLIDHLIEANLDPINEQKRCSLSKKTYLLYEGAIGESHLHQADWPIQEAKDICSQILN
ncbi:MAG: TetR/AcrR family transcriptional regulator, partial [Salibacteraceae bacterium]